MQYPVLRVARPTNNIDALKPFYRDGLGLELLLEFRDHDGFDGAIFGLMGAPYHFEFTRHPDHTAGRAPTKEHLAVLYFPVDEEWRSSISRMQRAGFDPVQGLNPYWDLDGCTFEDPDGYRIVLQNGEWSR